MARIAHGLYRGKFLRAVSVGFIPLCWQNADGTEHQVARGVPTAPHPLPSDGRGTKGEGFRRRYLEQELLEVSAVAIPANPKRPGARPEIRRCAEIRSPRSRRSPPPHSGSPSTINSQPSTSPNRPLPPRSPKTLLNPF